MIRPILFRFYKFNLDDSYRHNSLRLFGFNWWSSYYYDGIGWFRIFGKGLHWKDINKHELIFSQRSGHQKSITIGKWRIAFLK